MFAFHYFFENENIFNNILKIIKDNLKQGGIFFGTIYDGASVAQHAPISTKEFRIKMVSQSKSLFGYKIYVNHTNTIIENGSLEYLIFFDLLVKKMEESGFVLDKSQLFSEMEGFDQLDEKDKFISGLNRWFAFRKL
jgi:hypothetical protein